MVFSLLATEVPVERRSQTLNLVYLPLYAAGIIGPAIGGTLAAAFGTSAPFYAAAAVFLIGSVVVTLPVHPAGRERPRRRRRERGRGPPQPRPGHPFIGGLQGWVRMVRRPGPEAIPTLTRMRFERFDDPNRAEESSGEDLA
jgi:MFS family permease